MMNNETLSVCTLLILISFQDEIWKQAIFVKSSDYNSQQLSLQSNRTIKTEDLNTLISSNTETTVELPSSKNIKSSGFSSKFMLSSY